MGAPFKMAPIALAGFIAVLPAAHAEDGVSADKIVLGQAAALTGPAAALGQGMKMGLEAAFAEVNKAGGIKGRKLELKSVDDGYEPTRSIGVVKKLLNEDKVFAIIGTVGTPTAAAILPIAANAGVPVTGEGTYERNTVAIKTALLAVRKAKPEAVVMISSYKPAAAFIKLAREIKFDPTFVNVSFVGSDALAKELGPNGAGVVVTQVVPFPLDSKIPVVARYQASLKAIAPDAKPGFVSLEGYLVGRTLIAGLEKIDGAPTRKGLVEAVQKASPIDFGGMKLSYSTTNNRGSDHVFLTVIQTDGSLKAVDRLGKAGM